MPLTQNSRLPHQKNPKSFRLGIHLGSEINFFDVQLWELLDINLFPQS